MSVDRREVCKLLAGIPFLAHSLTAKAINGPKKVGGMPGDITFDVLLHGMFAIIVDQSGITLLPPDVCGETPHVYLAVDATGDLSSAKHLLYGSTHNFDLLPTGDRPDPDTSKHPIVQLSNTIVLNANAEPHCTITLPFPSGFVPLHSVTPRDPQQPIFSNPSGLICQPNQVPLVTMLRYKLGESPNGSLRIKYHLFAEPSICPATFHSSEAFDSLKGLFSGLDTLTLNTCLGLHDFDDNIQDPAGSDTSASEEMALVERLGLTCTDPDQSNCPPMPLQGACQAKSLPATGPALAGRPPRLGIHPTACMSMVFLST